MPLLAWPSLPSNNRSFHSLPPFSSPTVRFNFAGTSRCSFFPFLTTRRYSLGNFSVFTSASTTTSPTPLLLILVSLFSFFFALFLYSSLFFSKSPERNELPRRSSNETQQSTKHRKYLGGEKSTARRRMVSKWRQNGGTNLKSQLERRKRGTKICMALLTYRPVILFMAKCVRFFDPIFPPFHSFHFLQPLAAFVSSVNFALRSVFCFSSTVYFYLTPFELSTVPVSQ